MTIEFPRKDRTKLSKNGEEYFSRKFFLKCGYGKKKKYLHWWIVFVVPMVDWWHGRHLGLFLARTIVRDSHHREYDMPQAEFEPSQNLSSGFVEWSSAVVITTALWCHKHTKQTNKCEIIEWKPNISLDIFFIFS